MRIISGKLRGKKILEPKDKATRPLKDLTKESIFNILLHTNKFKTKIQNSNILDLFCGVGSFGLECFSRGAMTVTFVENYNNVLPVLKKNISNLGCQKNSIIIENDINNNLNFNIFEKRFDIIFMDPPYKDNNLPSILSNIIKFKMLNNDGIIVIHRHRKQEDKFPPDFFIIEEKIYGISKVIFGRYFK